MSSQSPKDLEGVGDRNTFLDSNENIASVYSKISRKSQEEEAPSLDVIRQDKSKLVEEEYRVKEWAHSQVECIKANNSLKVKTFVDASKVEIRENVISVEIHTENEKTSKLKTRMQILFFSGGIIKLNCVNPANPSKFSFELVEKPANLTPLRMINRVQIDSHHLAASIDESHTLVMDFDPFLVTVYSTENHSEEPLFEMNSNQSLRFDENLCADFTFHTECLYGIPERAHHLLVEDTQEDLPYRFYNLDIFGYAALSKNGVYGCIPMMITRKKESPSWVSIFWQNASETYLEVHKSQELSDTFWISERGNLETYVFINNSTKDHFESMSNVIGKCAMPQYFSLGYHQCRYSYNDQQDVLSVNQKFNEHEIPCDSITLDIDHTDEMRYFTWNYDLFPDPVMLQEVLERDGRKLITIADPHIKVDDKYKVYQGAALKDLCIKDKDNNVFVGECWPGESIYLDYLNEETQEYWASCYSYENYVDSTPNLFAWNDMNEPSVFEEQDKTLPKDALHTVKSLAEPEKAFQVEEREVHNLFGYTMSKATYLGLLRRNKDQNIRPHALSRSFFAGSQKWCTIWTGDTLSSWEHLRISVPMLLSMSLCGLSFVGSDVGGFVGDPEPELMVRWYQLGTFMPYFRGHSDKRCSRREPWLCPKGAFELVKEAIKERYRLLPYWYTLFEEHCRTSMPIMRPVWLDQTSIRREDLTKDQERFMLGDALLVVPVLEPGVFAIKDPLQGLEGRWYDYYTKREVLPVEEVHFGMERIGCFLKGGNVVPTFDIENFVKSSQQAKESNINLLIGVNEYSTAQGSMYFDDGETFNFKKGAFLRKNIEFQEDQLVWENQGYGGYDPNNKVTRAILMGARTQKFSKAYLQEDGGTKQKISLIKNAGNIVLEFAALTSKNWKIFLH